MLLSQSEHSPYIIKESKKQGWRVWVREGNCYTQKLSDNNKWKYKLAIKTKYRCIKGKFKNPYEADLWARNYMFKITLDKSYLSDS